METDKRQWYVRWFFWSLSIVNEFAERDTAWQYKRGVNLCPAVRIIVGAPIILLLHLAVYSAAITAVTFAPIYFYGWSGYGLILEWVGSLVAAFVAIKLLFGYLRKRARAREEARRHEPRAAKPAPKEEPLLIRGPTFWEIVWTYIDATHDKLCPYIGFKQEETVQ